MTLTLARKTIHNEIYYAQRNIWPKNSHSLPQNKHLEIIVAKDRPQRGIVAQDPDVAHKEFLLTTRYH